MAKLPKCKYCKQDVADKSEDKAIKVGSYWYHIECYHKHLSEKELGKTDKQKLFDYIQFEIYNGDAPASEFILAQKYQKEFNYKWSGMQLTLKLIMEQELDIDYSRGNIVGLIPYYYTKAKLNYIKEKEMTQVVEDFEYKDITNIRHRSATNNRYYSKMKNRFTMEEIMNG